LELGIAKRVVEVDDEQQLEQVLFVGAYLSVATCQNDYRHIHEEVPDEIHEERDLNLLQEGDVLLRQLVGLGEVQDHIPEIMRVDQVGIVEAVRDVVVEQRKLVVRWRPERRLLLERIQEVRSPRHEESKQE